MKPTIPMVENTTDAMLNFRANGSEMSALNCAIIAKMKATMPMRPNSHTHPQIAMTTTEKTICLRKVWSGRRRRSAFSGLSLAVVIMMIDQSSEYKLNTRAALLSQRGRAMLRVCQWLASVVQNVEQSLLLLVT